MTRSGLLRDLGVAVLLIGGAVTLFLLRGSPARGSSHSAPSAAWTEEPSATAAPPVTPSAAFPSSAGPAPAAAGPLDEQPLMERLRALQITDPEQAVELARDGISRFGVSADAPERTSILIHALAKLGRVSEARAEAESMVDDYDDSRWVREVELFTGAHRHRNVRVSEDGAIELY